MTASSHFPDFNRDAPGGVAIAPPSPETTQRTLAALEVWAAGVTVVHLEGALERALQVAGQSPVVAHLVDTEYQALDEAAWLESAASSNARLGAVNPSRPA